MKIFEVIDSEKCYYIVSELLTGGELFEKVLSEMRFTEKLAAKYTNQIISAINYCHIRGIVHRDLKPENLLLANQDPNTLLKVIDFGISQKLVPGTKLTTAIGTLYYMAPEVFSGSYDQKCDIWSAGVILYLMLSGRPPFVGNTENEVLKKISGGNPDLTRGVWANISEEAKDLIRRMMTLDSSKRISANDVLNHHWIKSHINNEIADNPINQKAFSQLKEFRVNFI